MRRKRRRSIPLPGLTAVKDATGRRVLDYHRSLWRRRPSEDTRPSMATGFPRATVMRDEAFPAKSLRLLPGFARLPGRLIDTLSRNMLVEQLPAKAVLVEEGQ